MSQKTRATKKVGHPKPPGVRPRRYRIDMDPDQIGGSLVAHGGLCFLDRSRASVKKTPGVAHEMTFLRGLYTFRFFRDHTLAWWAGVHSYLRPLLLKENVGQ